MLIVIVVILAMGVLLAGALRLVIRFAPRATIAGPQCRRCGYSLIGNQSGVCPECGVILDEITVVRPGQRRPPNLRLRLIAWLACCFLAVVLIPAAVIRHINETGWVVFSATRHLQLTNAAWSEQLSVEVHFDEEDPARPARLMAVQVTGRPLPRAGADAPSPGGVGAVIVDPTAHVFVWADSAAARAFERTRRPLSGAHPFNAAAIAAWLSAQGYTDAPAFASAVQDIGTAASHSRTETKDHLHAADAASYRHEPAPGTVGYSGGGESMNLERKQLSEGVFTAAAFGFWVIGCVLLRRDQQRIRAAPAQALQAHAH